MASDPEQALDLLVPQGPAKQNRWSIFSVASSAASTGSEPRHWINRDRADYFFAGVIVANAIMLGVDIQVGLDNGGDSGTVLFLIQVAFYLVFLFEIVVKIYVDGYNFFRFSNLSGLFDLFVVLAGTLEYLLLVTAGTSGKGLVSAMRVCRLLRIVRIGRILHLCPELWILVTSLVASMRGIAYVLLSLMVLLYICCLITTMELANKSDALEEYFGSLDRSLFTHFMVLTLEGYPDVADAAGEVTWVWYLYIIGFIIISSILVINLVTGIIVEHVCSKNNTKDEDPYFSAAFDLQHFRELFIELYSAAGFPPDQEVGLEEFTRIFQSEAIRDGMNALDICLTVDERELFKILDGTGAGKVTVENLIAGLMRLQGSKFMRQSVFTQGDATSNSLKVKKRFERARAEVCNYSESVCTALEDKLTKHVSDIWLATKSLPTPHASPLCKQPVLEHLPQLLETLEASSTDAGLVLERLKSELEASRERVRHLESKVQKRGISVQTDFAHHSVSDEWNHDRESVVKQVQILAEHRALPPVQLDFSVGIDRLMDEREAERNAIRTRALKADADPTITVTLVRATGLQTESGKCNSCCSCVIPGKPLSRFLTKVAPDTLNPSWDETHELTNYKTGDPLEFIIMDINNVPNFVSHAKSDVFIAAGRLGSEQFFPHGFDGELELTEPHGRRSGNGGPHLRVKVCVQGSALKQILASPASDLDALSSISKEQTDPTSIRSPSALSFLPKTPPLTAVAIDRHNEFLQKFRSHPCSSGKESALDAMRTPSSSGDEAPLGAWRRESQRPRSASASPSLGSSLNAGPQMTPSSTRGSPFRPRGRSADPEPVSQAARPLLRHTPRPITQTFWPEASSLTSFVSP